MFLSSQLHVLHLNMQVDMHKQTKTDKMKFLDQVAAPYRPNSISLNDHERSTTNMTHWPTPGNLRKACPNLTQYQVFASDLVTLLVHKSCVAIKLTQPCFLSSEMVWLKVETGRDEHVMIASVYSPAPRASVARSVLPALCVALRHALEDSDRVIVYGDFNADLDRDANLNSVF